MTNFRGVLVAILVLTFTLDLCISSQQVIIDQSLKQVADVIDNFAFRLYKQLAASSANNIFFSPLSLSTIMGMLHFGLRGASAKEIEDVIGYVSTGTADKNLDSTFNRLMQLLTNSSSGYTMDFGNAILIDKYNVDLRPEYRTAVQEMYQAPVARVNFRRNSNRIVDGINKWVRNKTRGKIRNMVNGLDPRTLILILNAVYFKATWKTQFLPSSTKQELFYNGGTEPKIVSMMHNNNIFNYTSTPDFQALELPYTGDHISMLILLPNEKNGLSDLENILTTEKMHEIRQFLEPTKVQVALPKFKVEFEENLAKAFQAMGIRKIFQGGSDDFSGISVKHSKNLFVKDVIHKAVIETNEEGSEAAAATAVIVHRTRAAPEFKANHPFIFLLLDNRSELVLFIGRVTKL